MALGGADTITVNDLSRTGVTRLNLDLAAMPSSGIGDGQADTVIVNGTDGNDTLPSPATPACVKVSGLAAA